MILGKNSRLLHKELGQQVPIKSRQKMNRDISKFMNNSLGIIVQPPLLHQMNTDFGKLMVLIT